MSYDDIERSGAWWFAHYSVLNTFVTNWNAFLTKVDADTGDTTFDATYNVADTTIGNTFGTDLSPRSWPQGKLGDLCQEIRTDYNDALDAFASDDGINGTTVFTDEKFGASEHLMEIHGRYGMYSVCISKQGIKKIVEYFSQNALFEAIDVEMHLIPTLRKYAPKHDIISVNVASFSSNTRSSERVPFDQL